MSEITLTGFPHDIGWVRAVMLFPDEQAAKQCFAVERARLEISESNDSDLLEIDALTLRLLIDAPAYSALKNMTAESTKRGIVAGDLLSTFYIMDRFNLPEPSMNKALFAVHEYAQKAAYGDGSKINASERMARESWDQFMPVAHLWAAFRINRAYPFAPTMEVFSKEGFIPFLRAAAALYDFGTKFIPFRAKDKKSILDPAICWALPKNITPANLFSDRKPERLIKILKKYKAPKSGI